MIESLRQVNTILVRCPNWVGDLVMAIPVFDCLRENFPQARLVGIAQRNAQGILRDGPWFEQFIDCEDKNWRGFKRMVSRIRELQPDLALILPNSVRSLLPVRLAGVKSIYGYRRNLRGLFLSGGPQPLRENGKFKPLPMQKYYLEICRYLGLTLPQEPRPRLYVGAELQRKGGQLLDNYGIRPQDKVVGLNVGASFGSSKCWPMEYFAELAELVEDKLKSKVLLLAGPGEERLARDIIKMSRAQIINTAADAIDLELLKPIVRRCQLLITNDTGPRHYAVAFDVPVVVIMGPTDPRYTESNLDKTVVLRRELECSNCHKKICPTDHKCMRQITPRMVLEAAVTLLKEHAANDKLLLSR